MIETKIEVQNVDKVLGQLRQLDQKVQNRTIRKATTAAGAQVLKETKASAQQVKQTGFTARSIRNVVKSRRGLTTYRVGQAKQRTFKARKSTRVKGRNLSQIQRAAKPVPIHWIERGTKPHFIRAKPGKRLVFVVGRRTKFKRGLAFATQVFSKGMKPRHVLRTAARRSRSKAASAFFVAVQQGVKV